MLRLFKVDVMDGEDNGNARDVMVLEEDERVDHDVVGDTRHSTWRSTSRRSPVEAARLGGATTTRQGVSATRVSGSGACGAAVAVL